MNIVYISFPNELNQVHSIELNETIYINLSYCVGASKTQYNLSLSPLVR